MSLGKLIKAQKRKDDLIITPRYELWIRQHPELILEPWVTDWMQSQLQGSPRIRSGSFSASSQGSCPRQQVFSYVGAPQHNTTSSDQIMIFQDGHFRHLKWQALHFQAGIISKAEVPIDLPEFKLKGTIDAIGSAEGWGRYGVEYKGANDRNYRWVLENGVMEKHMLQVHAYMLGSGLDLWSVIYENKNTQEWKEFTIRKSEEWMDRLMQEIQGLNFAIDSKTLPSVLESCIDKKAPYTNCPYKKFCLDTYYWHELEEVMGRKRIKIVRSA